MSDVDPTVAMPPVTREEHIALKALAKGEANEGQQVLALSVIIKKFAQPQDLLYVKDSFDATAFVNGRAFVASRIRYYVKKPVENA